MLSSNNSSGRYFNRKSLRQVVLGFVIGVVCFGLGSLIRYTEHQLRAASADHDHSFGVMSPFHHDKSKCDCNQDGRKHVALQQTNQSITIATSGNDDEFREFDPNAPVVIATKIHGENTFSALKQSLCLLTKAYNYRVNYDVVVFSATEVNESLVDMAREIIAPAKFTLVLDNPGLQTMVDALSEDHKQNLLERCNATHSSQLLWQTRCVETASAGTSEMPIAYNWQAEFRSLHIWKHPAIAKYRYMLWMDTDGFCTKVWQQDPIATMRRNDLVILFDHFPGGRANGVEWIAKTKEAFGKQICEISMRNGTLRAFEGYCKRAKFLRQIYGFFHITNLDFYRSDPVMKWQKIMIGDSKFSRLYDDQIAVTMPAAVLAGNRSWHMKYFGLNLGVAHNFLMDGDKREKIGAFKNFWKEKGKETFPEAYGQCRIVSAG